MCFYIRFIAENVKKLTNVQVTNFKAWNSATLLDSVVFD